MSVRFRDELYSIGRYVSESEQLFDTYVEYRMEAIHILKIKLENMNIPQEIKENLLTTIFIMLKSMSFFEFSNWKYFTFGEKHYKSSLEDLKKELDIYAQKTVKEVTEALIKSNMTMEKFYKSYKKVLASIDLIAEKIIRDGSSSINEIFILNCFGVKNKCGLIK